MDDLLGLADLLRALDNRSQPMSRAAKHLLRLDLQEVYEFAARNPAALSEAKA